MRRFVLAAFALTVLAACQPATTEFTEEQRHDTETEVRATLDTMWGHFIRGDFDRGITYWEDSPATDFAETDGRIVNGFATLDSLYRPGFAAVASQEINFDVTIIKPITLDAVYAMQNGTYAQTDTAGVTGPTRPFAYTYLWVRTDSGWKISSAHMSAGDLETQ